MPDDATPEGTINSSQVSWTALLIAKRFSRRLRQRIRERKTRLPVCDADALDDIVRARLEQVTPQQSDQEITPQQLLRTASEFVHDAMTGHETDLLRSRHTCALWLAAPWYLAFIQVIATAWIATLFAEAAPGVPADSPGAIPVRWSVGGAELAFLIIAACDCVAHCVLECQARPLSQRVTKIQSVLCPNRMPTANGTSAGYAILPDGDQSPSRVRSSRLSGFRAPESSGIELKPHAVSSPIAVSAMRRASLRHVASSATLGEEEGGSQSRVRLRLRDWLFFQDKLWENGAFIVILLGIVEWVIYYAAGVHYFRLSRPLRPILLISKSPDLRRNLAIILRTFAAIGQITALFVLLLLFYAVLGCQLFSPEQVSGYDLTNDNFGNFTAASLTMFVLQSTENFPTVMYPALEQRPTLALIFFLSGLYAFAWVITPLLLAVQYEHYQTVMDSAVRAQRAKGYVPMLAAYKCVARAAAMRRELADRGSGGMLIPVLPTAEPKITLQSSSLPSSSTAGTASVSAARGSARQLSTVIEEDDDSAIDGTSSNRLRDSADDSAIDGTSSDRLRGSADDSAIGFADESAPKSRLQPPPPPPRVNTKTTAAAAAAAAAASSSGLSDQGGMIDNGRSLSWATDLSAVPDLRTDRSEDEETFVEFLTMARGLRRPAARALFHALDVEEEAHSDSLVTAAEFLTLPQFLRLSPPGMRSAGCSRFTRCCSGSVISEAQDGSGDGNDSIRCTCYTAHQRSIMRETARALLRHPVVHWVMTLAVWLSAVAACWWSWPEQQVYNTCVKEHGRAYCWDHSVMVEEYVALAALSVGVIEITVRVTATGGILRWITASYWNSFDLVVICWSWAASLAISMGAKQALPPGTTDLLEITRAARVLRVLSTVPELRAFVDVVAAGRTISIPRTALMYAVLTVCVMLLWATVGQQLFGDVPGMSMDGQIYTFETLGYAMLDMTQVLAVNNWNSIMYAVVPRARGGMATSLFFVSFFFVGSMVLTNCVSGIIIDYYSIAQADAQRERIQQSLFTGLGGEDDDDDDEDDDEEDADRAIRLSRRAGILDPLGRVAVPPLDIALRILCCCGGRNSSHHEEELLLALRTGVLTTSSSIMALPLWLLDLVMCSKTGWSRVRSICCVPVSCCSAGGAGGCCSGWESRSQRNTRERRLRKLRHTQESFHEVVAWLPMESVRCVAIALLPCCCCRGNAKLSGVQRTAQRTSRTARTSGKSRALLSEGSINGSGDGLLEPPKLRQAHSQVQPVAGLGRLSAKVMREYVAQLREELREDIESQSPPRVWRMLRQQARRGRGSSDASDDDASDDEYDEYEDDEDNDVFVLSEAQALLLRQELGDTVFSKDAADK